MGQRQFRKLVNSPSERIPRRIRDSKTLDPELGEFCVRDMTVAYNKFQYSSPGSSPTAPRKRSSAQFTQEALDASLASFQKTAKAAGSASRRFASKTNTGMYVFHWHAVTDKDLDYVEEQSRRHAEWLRNWETKNKDKLGRKGKGKTESFKGEKTVGGHLESSAFMTKLRIAVAKGVLTEEEAEEISHAFMHGGLEETLARIGSTSGIKTDTKTPKGGDVGFLNIVENQESVEVNDDLIKNVYEDKTRYSINREVMVAVPDSLNQAQKNSFEQTQIKNITSWLDALAGPRLYEDETSLSMERMHQEIIAAALLGKKVPKYKVSHKQERKSKRIRKTRKIKLPKSKKTATNAAKAQFLGRLRNSAGQFASPTSLMALLNKKLPQEIQNNMGLPGLEYDTGKFAQSVRAIKMQQSKNTKMPTIQYTYDTDPYQVFETGGKGDSRWATKDRDPRVLIDKTIREIAQEMMISKFSTQRL